MSDSVNWTERGRELSASLTQCHSIVVIGRNVAATAEVALGIARDQALHRRVAVGDLLGEAPQLQSLVTGEDPHGIVDSFEFGVSLNRVARSVADSGELFVIPSGSTPIDHAELFPNPRWKRLSGGFREVGALLVLVASVDAPKLKELVESTDGAIIVGDVVPVDLPVARTIAWLRGSKTAPTQASAQPARASAPLAVTEAARTAVKRTRNQQIASVAGIVLTLVAAGLAFWFSQRPWAGVKPKREVSATTTTAGSAAATILQADSGAPAPAVQDPLRTSTGVLAAAASLPDSFPVLAPTNVRDSSSASAWAVRLQPTNTKSGAILELRGRFETVPAGTYGYDLRTRFFQLVAGAYPSRAGAESLLVQLRTRKILAPADGSVIALPFAYLVQADVPAADVPARLARFAARGHPVYALRQRNGSAHLYFGAYETPQHAALAVPTVREAGVTPTLVYRIGRVF